MSRLLIRGAPLHQAWSAEIISSRREMFRNEEKLKSNLSVLGGTKNVMRRSIFYSIGSCLALFCLLIFSSIHTDQAAAQAQQPSTLVIEGGTLIDGNGGTPVPDAL